MPAILVSIIVRVSLFNCSIDVRFFFRSGHRYVSKYEMYRKYQTGYKIIIDMLNIICVRVDTLFIKHNFQYPHRFE